MEKFKREKAKAKGGYTPSRTKLLMTMEDGRSSRTQVIECLDSFVKAFENIVCVCENLQSFYETTGDLEKLRAVSCELEAMEGDFNETEQIVKGYLDSSRNDTAHVSRSAPTGQSSIKQRKQLEQEITRQETEFNRIVQGLERTYAECQREIQQKRIERWSSGHAGPQSEAGMAVMSSPLSNGIVTSTPFHPQTSVSEPVPSHSTVTSHPSHMYLSSSGTRTAPQSSPNTKQVQHMTPGSSQPSNSTTDQLSIDSVALLKRVSVPKFSGNKKNYQAWKAAFYSCVNQTRATPEYKLLRMRECLQGEALKVVENLGHCRRLRSSKTRLERKYGGTRRALTLRLEELDAFRPIREGNEKDLEGFAELLDAIVVNLTDAGQVPERECCNTEGVHRQRV